MAHEIIGHAVKETLQRELVGLPPREGTVVNYALRGAKGDMEEFLEERFAMSAEWEFLHSIPRDTREKIIEQISVDPKLTQEQREYHLRLFRNASLSLSEYLEAEYSAGRYSLEKIRSTRRQFTWLVYGMASTVSGLLIGACAVDHCQKLEKQLAGRRTENAFYRFFCMNMGWK